jgi:NAD(P)-dependent dehydrogenase (short-subunit alcohol dehydrogenase family)
MNTEPPTTRRFDGKVVIVTGAGNGIGLCIAQTFAEDGASVVVAEIEPSAGKRAVQTITDAGGSASFVPVDVSDEEQVEAMVATTVERYGRVDILVNNAGVVVHKLLIELEREEWDRQLAVQTTGPFLTSKHVARHMIARGGPGKIVNIASVAGLQGRIRCGPHCVAKAGVISLTRVLALELGEYKINVNVLAPGLIDVPYQEDEKILSTVYKNSILEMLPLGRIGQPIDIARGVQFLACSDSDWITGQVFVADGGLTAGHYNLQGLQDFSMLGGHL